MWGISYFKLDSLKERKFAFQRIKFAFQRIKFAFQRFKFEFQRIKFAFQRIKFAFQRIKFAFQRIKFAFQRIKFAFQRIKFAFQRIKFAFQRIKFAFQRIKFAFQRIKFAFQRIKFAFQRIKFASKESSCCKVVVSSVVHRTLCDLYKLGFLLEIAKRTMKNVFVSYYEQFRQKQSYQQTEPCEARASKQKFTISLNFPQERITLDAETLFFFCQRKRRQSNKAGLDCIHNGECIKKSSQIVVLVQNNSPQLRRPLYIY